jgi:lipopolysaccharide export system protein LptA
MVDIEGNSYRKVVGPASFLHNNAYLYCDTALWNVETRIIEAWGHVSIKQDNTVLKSDKLTYLIDLDLAQFRGSVVELTDKDKNTLRTRHLDYNTKDSVAIFDNGASMRDKDGQIIESVKGTYDSKVELFTFTENVNMFTDSIFVKTNTLTYDSPRNLATFGYNTNAWKEENMLSADGGWYNRAKEIFFFRNNVHVMSDSQEGWCDSLFFYRNTSDVEMLGHAQVSDTTRNVFGIAGRIFYLDSLSKVTMTRKPAVITETDEKGVKDTVYLGADKLVYYALPMFKVDSMAVEDAKKREETLNIDPVGAFRKKAAEEAAKAAEEAAKNDPNYRPKTPRAGAAANQSAAAKSAVLDTPEPTPATPLPVAPDTLLASAPMMLPDSIGKRDTMSMESILAARDSIGVVADTSSVADTVQAPEPPKDSTRIGFLEAIRNVRIYRKDMQLVCDSLMYTDLDSIARMYTDPVIWQEEKRQYSSDSLYVVVSKGRLDKANLMSNAFIAIQEDTLHYNQIKSTEMMAYFDKEGGLRRFDALGGAQSLFYIEENDVLATVNKTDSKMMSANFKDGELQRIYYFEQAKNDGYPVVQLSDDERYLKGFNWQEKRRPADRNAVTPLSLRPSQRSFYERRPRAQYKQTNIYFPGYIDNVYRQIEVRDSLRKVRQREAAIAKRQAEEKARLDSIAFADSVLRDSLFRVDSLAKADSLNRLNDKLLKDAADSLKAIGDSLMVSDSLAADRVLTPEEIKAAKKAEAQRKKEAAKAAREAAAQKRQEEKEKRWAELDNKDEIKAKKKEEKKLQKLRKKKRKALEDQARQEARDAAVLEKYRQKFEQQKQKKQQKTTSQPKVLKPAIRELSQPAELNKDL